VARSQAVINAERLLRQYVAERASPRCGMPKQYGKAFYSAAEKKRIDNDIQEACAQLDAQILEQQAILTAYALSAQEIEAAQEIEELEIRAERDVRQTEITGQTKFQSFLGFAGGVVDTAALLAAGVVNPSMLPALGLELEGAESYVFDAERGGWFPPPPPPVDNGASSGGIVEWVRANPVPTGAIGLALVAAAYYATR